MNILEKWIEFQGEDEAEVMDLLQNAGVVSDNAVVAGDVCEADAKRAVEFLEER